MTRTSTAIAQAAAHINVSVTVPVTEAELLELLRCGGMPTPRDDVLASFFLETDTDLLQDMVVAGAVSYAVLASGAARFLAPEDETRIWLDECARLSVAGSV